MPTCPKLCLCLVFILTPLVASTHAAADERRRAMTDDLFIELDTKTGYVHSLVNRRTHAQWFHQPTPIYRLSSTLPVDATLDLRPTQHGLVLTLRLRNQQDQPVRVTPTFPALTLHGSDAQQTESLRYCFPARSSLVGTEPVSDRGYYSGIFPLQFLAADHPDQGAIYVILQDQQNTRKLFGIDKTAEQLDLFAAHEARELQPGETWTLPPVLLNITSGTWHDGLQAYRRWLETWYRPAAPRRDWFANVFHFRCHYLYFGQPRGSEVFDAQTRQWRLQQTIDRDIEAFGGIDYVHLFDWAHTPEHGRVGDYQPWAQFGSLDQFNSQLDKLIQRDIIPGLYVEGYLVTKNSEAGRRLGEQARMLHADGSEVNVWGGNYFTMCPHVPAWQDYLAQTYRRLARDTKAAGIYVDQFGFLTQYHCHNPDHARHHPMGSHMLAGEWQTLRKLRQAVGDRVVLYTEEVPTDVMTQYIDGAYTASVHISMNKNVACPINLTRFALPDFKVIELISEAGLGDNLAAVRFTFFNGNGIYLSGDADERYSEACRALLRKTYRLLREYKEAFTSFNPVPLIATQHPQLYANAFPAEDYTLWTLYNAGDEPLQAAPLLRVPHVAGATYYDAWHDRDIEPIIEGDHAILPLTLNAQDVGCIVQRLEK